jgi:hypothetical protein
MTAIKRVANANARSYVKKRVEFQGSNAFARELHTDHSTLYVVYSYGEHFPMFIAETDNDNVTRWYANQDRFSMTTTKHWGQLHPHVEYMVPMDTARMRVLAHGGLMELFSRGAGL